MPWTQPLELVGQKIRLRPLLSSDAPKLVGVATAETFLYYVGPVVREDSLKGTTQFVEQMLKLTDMAFVVELRGSGEIVGMSSYLDIREPQRGVEIGRTWITKPYRGTFVNPEMKLLMLEHAFEHFKCIRVQLKCDARNEQSAAAIQKLGAKPEGVLRNHRIPPDLGIGNTAMFSIIDSEWPDVKRRLIERIRSAG